MLDRRGTSTRWQSLAWHVLRVGAGLCFIGHGAFGIITKEAWVPYFGLVGIPGDVAFMLMPLVGTVDILVGLAVLIYPTRAAFAYMAVWALWTAALRPLTGEPVWELLERAGNYGVPLALLLMAGLPATVRGWWSRVRSTELAPGLPRSVRITLQATVVLLLVGHAGFGIEGRPLLETHYATLGLGPSAVPILGGFELGIAAALAAAATPVLLVFAAVWKMATELLYPLAGHPVWEFVERSGSYAAPVGLTLLIVGVRDRVRAGSEAMAIPLRRPALAVGLSLIAILWLTAVLSVTTALAATGAGVAESPDAVAISPEGPGVASAIGRATATGTPRDTVWNRLAPASLLNELDQGNLVLACRHAITDRSRGDARRVDFDDRSTQRNLSRAGERQARELGWAFSDLGIPIGPVLTSPYARTHESAELTFGRAEVHRALYGQNDGDALRALLALPTDGSGNRVLMTHQYILRRVLRVFAPGEIAEGDCVVVRPLGPGGFDIAARMSPDAWKELR